VPDSVCQIMVDVFGAQGGGVGSSDPNRGARATAAISAMPGEALQVNVGEQGGNGDDGGNGGFNGGGGGIAGQGGGNGTAGSCGDGGDGPGLGGGAGGGGWFGGGGGGGNDNTNPGGVSGGGGGGSGLGPAGTAFETGVREGYGLVAITFDPAASTCGAAMAPAPGPAPVVEADPRFTG
jgi:hypothetical protein